MKKRIFLVTLAMLAFGLAVGAYAYYGSAGSASSATATCCPHSGESCPMTHKNASTGETASCCDNCDCCNGTAESCPMKTGASGALTEHKHDASSCPMKKDASASDVTTKHDTAMHGEGCCCPCCGKDKEKEAAPAV